MYQHMYRPKRGASTGTKLLAFAGLTAGIFFAYAKMRYDDHTEDMTEEEMDDIPFFKFAYGLIVPDKEAEEDTIAATAATAAAIADKAAAVADKAAEAANANTLASSINATNTDVFHDLLATAKASAAANVNTGTAHELGLGELLVAAKASTAANTTANTETPPCVNLVRGVGIFTGCNRMYTTLSDRNEQCKIDRGTGLWIGDNKESCQMSRQDIVFTGCGNVYSTKAARDAQCKSGNVDGNTLMFVS